MRLIGLAIVMFQFNAFAGTPLTQYSVRYENHRVSYFLSKGPKDDLPLIIYILGSGCMSQLEHFRKAPFILSDEFGKKASLVFVEKPGIVKNSGNNGTAVGCTDEFKRKFTVDTSDSFSSRRVLISS